MITKNPVYLRFKRLSLVCDITTPQNENNAIYAKLRGNNMKSAYLIIILLLLTGCATHRERVQYVTVERHDTLTLERVLTDSIHVHDSVTVYQLGDTIVKTRWRVEYRDRWREKVRDVVRVERDTVRVTDTVVKEYRPTLWQRVKMGMGGVAVFFLAIGLLSVIVHRFFHK